MPIPKPQGSALLTLLVVVLIIGTTGCGYGIVGKKPPKPSTSSTRTLSPRSTRSAATPWTTSKKPATRFGFLQNGTCKEAHDISVGMLEETIGYLDSIDNREALAKFVETMINHTSEAARRPTANLLNLLGDPPTKINS